VARGFCGCYGRPMHDAVKDSHWHEPTAGENAGFGAANAAPVARKVLDTYLLDADGKLKPSATPSLPEPRPETRPNTSPQQIQASATASRTS